jgi:hypothetical protein
LFGDTFQFSAGLQALAYEQLWLKEDLSASFQQKNYRAGEKEKIIETPLVNH